jgi:hypothetical protein
MFLKKLQLENFKCYKKATIPFKKLSIILGENNAGKSCLIEALRLVSKAAQISRKRVYCPAPISFELPANIRGFKIDTRKLKIDLKIIIYYYQSSQYAKITAFFENKAKIEIYLNASDAFAVLYNSEGKNIKSKQQAEKLGLDSMAILPQIGPIKVEEKLLSYDTVYGDKDTYLSSLHFRNEIWMWRQEYFEEFKRDSEDSWNGLCVDPIEYDIANSDYISLLVKDNGFTAEIGEMGNGLQMWLQIMWFLARSKNCKLIILDEPDVYMHSDMQRKILELVKSRFEQIIIATHSLEIISRVDPDNILEINKKDKTMHYATDSLSAQKIIDDIGGVQNLALLNLGRVRKCLFVEGKDLKYLNSFNEILYGKQLEVPTISFGGFNNISRVYGTSNLFFSETTNQIKCYALADKDYRDLKIIEKVKNEANDEHLNLHIWHRKEIENYLIIPEILFKLIPNTYGITYDKFLLQLETLLDEQRDKVFDAYANQYRIDCKELDHGQQWDIATCNQYARNYLKEHWNNINDKISMVGGKDFLSVLITYYKENFRVTLTIKKIMNELTTEMIPIELIQFLEQFKK